MSHIYVDFIVTMYTQTAISYYYSKLDLDFTDVSANIS